MGFFPLPGVRFPESSKEEVQDQKQLLKDAAAFLLSCQIPGLVRNPEPAVMLPSQPGCSEPAQVTSGTPEQPQALALVGDHREQHEHCVQGTRGFPFPILHHGTIFSPQSNEKKKNWHW